MSAGTEQMSSALLAMREQMGPLLDFIDGHRADLLARGYSETAAEAMTVDLYEHMLANVFRSAA